MAAVEIHNSLARLGEATRHSATVVAAISLEQEKGDALSVALKNQAEDCPANGRLMLLALARLAAPAAGGAPQASPKDAVRAALRLIQGGTPPASETPASSDK